MAINAEQNQLDQANKQNEANSQSAPTTGGGAASTTTSGRVASFSSGAPQQGSTGSGRFTNLQKYLGANQGATDRLYQGIGNKIEKTSEGKKQEADTQAGAVREGIEAANQNLNRGQGYYNQMKDQGFNAQDFVSDQDRLTDYAKFQGGQAVDVNALNKQNQDAQTAAMQLQNNYQQRANQVGSEEGRFGLLKETYGQTAPNYTTGQQRLDNLFLQAGSGGKVGALQNDVRNNLNTATQNLNALTGEATQNIGNIGTNQTNLAKNLLDTSTGMENSFVQNLESQIPGVNQQRQADIANARKELSRLVASNTPGGVSTGMPLSDQFLQQVGLDRGMRTYNAFGGTQNLEELARIGRDATNAQDLATQADADQYNALAKLAFGKVNDQGQYGLDEAKKRINGASTLDPAVQAILDSQGVSSAKNLIKGAEDQFWKNATGTNVTGYGGSATGDYGGIEVSANAQANLAQLLMGLGTTGTSAQTTNRGKFGDIGKGAVSDYNFGSQVDTEQDLINRINDLAATNNMGGGWYGYGQVTNNTTTGANPYTTYGGILAGQPMLGPAEQTLKQFYYGDSGMNKDLKDAISFMPGVGNQIGAVLGGLFGGGSRKNENLERTSEFLNYASDNAYDNLKNQALEMLANQGYFTKT